jgi:CRISPR system Cascade subunit CasB
MSRIGSLQAAAIAGAPSAAARLARLRRALTSEPGSDPDVWADTLGMLPTELLGKRDKPNDAERASHAAMTLFALHQQAQSAPMHVPGQTLGKAVQRLRAQTGETESDTGPTLRRFHVLATASSLEETLHHLRGMVTVLRGEHLGLDYGRLAIDLRRLQGPSTAPGVRLRWGRDLYRFSARPAKAGTPTDLAPRPSTSTEGDPS